MNHLLSKKQLKNEKNRQIKEKITKSYSTFCENKPNSKTIKIAISPFKASRYEILPAWRSKKQTQFKPNTNPIHERPKFALSSFMTSKYEHLCRRRVTKTNPNKAKNKFILECLSRGPNLTAQAHTDGYHRSTLYPNLRPPD